MIAEKRKLFFSFQVIQTATGDARQHHGRQPCIPVRMRQWALVGGGGGAAAMHTCEVEAVGMGGGGGGHAYL